MLGCVRRFSSTESRIGLCSYGNRMRIGLFVLRRRSRGVSSGGGRRHVANAARCSKCRDRRAGSFESPKSGLSCIAELASRTAVKTDVMMDAAVKAHRWAYLDQDARPS